MWLPDDMVPLVTVCCFDFFVLCPATASWLYQGDQGLSCGGALIVELIWLWYWFSGCGVLCFFDVRILATAGLWALTGIWGVVQSVIQV